MVRDLGDPIAAGQYRRILESVDKLERYFGQMAETLEAISDEGYKLQKQISRMIEEDTERTRAESKRIHQL